MGLEQAIEAQVVTPQELAERWRVGLDTLVTWRMSGKGPAFLQARPRGHVFYVLEEVVEWEVAARREKCRPRELTRRGFKASMVARHGS